ncbi:MAG: T9SS type A sorting domain-containing protein [Bacteroidales bacterium]|nr:T9SS type A sorting domain-containing protein [Bacteroidales bacterium]
MKKLVIIFFLLPIYSLVYSQKDINSDELMRTKLSTKQKIELASLPELKLPIHYKNKSVPYEVDNTIQSCYPGLFLQGGLSCGQAACVGIGFTYEINRVRGLDGSLVENQYPTHFTWNWENGGNGWHGASYYHSMLVLKDVGNPNMEIYGGTHDFGGGTRFMSGYDAYYEAMHNRINKAYAINCSDEEGILTLKHWINDHLDGSDVGGVAFFYSQHQNPGTTLPIETEHEGEKVVVSWGASANHAMSITGYNDSIKWDYNGDGQYTNDIDLNNDGIIDARDWEIGAFKMNNTYGGSYNGWMMYRTLALASNEGGIWNNAVNVLYPIKEYSPMLTYKVNLYYTNRGRIKIMAGFSTNMSASKPDYYMSFPIIDYQGAEIYMQGGTEEEDKYIEFGLDVTPFLNIIESGTPCKFFFQVLENDDDGWGSGEIVDFSVIDYTSVSPVEYLSTQTNQAIIQNGVTSVSVQHTPIFAKPEITTSTLPNADVYHQYSHQMQSQAGTPPYRWEFDVDYQMNETTNPLTDVTQTLNGTYINLPFDFKFYDETYSGFYLSNKGYIDFSGETYTLPYNNNNELSVNSVSFMNRKCIAGFFSNTSCSTYYESNANYYIVRWVGTDIDVSLKIESNGKITIFYNNCSPSPDLVWVSGLSLGNIANCSLTPKSGGVENITSIGYEFVPMSVPEVFSLSEDGLLTGIPTEEILAFPLNFKVTDAKGMIDRKTIPISTEGLIINYNITTANNNIIEWGENVDMNLILRNANETAITNLNISVTCENPDITIIDNTEFIGTLNPLQEISINAAFNFDLNFNFYNEQEITLHLTAISNQNTWEIDIIYPVYTADIQLIEYFVNDLDNNRLDIGETSDILYTFANEGGASIDDMEITVTSSDPFLTINQNTADIGLMENGLSYNANFNFTADAECLPGHVAILNFHITGANGYEKDIIGYVSIGQILEDWETGSFDSYNWNNGGDLPWFISDIEPYEGTYCLKSGNITNNQSSVLEIELQVIAAGNISFYRKVSCEDDPNNNNWDYLAFYINDIEQGRWDGIVEWAQESYSVTAGIHNFKWVYHKDVSVAANEDCAWIDLIEFPSIYDAEPLLTISVEEINKTMYPNETESDTIYISNMGGGIINYNLRLLNDLPWIRNSRNIIGSKITCSAQGFYAGDTVAWTFYASNASTDSEWIKEISINFPEGFLIDSLTDFYDQSNDTLHITNGSPGDGADFTWFGENPANNYGLLLPNEIAHTTVYGIINETFEENMRIYYSMQGDIYGSEPHFIEDSLDLFNYGPPVNWVNKNINIGALGIGQEDAIALNFDTHDLIPGEYMCNLKIYTNIDTVTIPINLTVAEPVSTIQNTISQIKVYPNPAKTSITIQSKDIITNICLINSLGQTIYQQNTNETKLSLNVEGYISGIYYLKINTTENCQFVKLLIE